MPYNANVPLANQQISASQPIINANFQAILAAFNANHTDLLTSTGLHSFVQFATRAAAPAFAGSPGFWASNAGTSPIMLHTTAGVDINLTDKVFAAPSYAGAFVTTTSSYFYLPCGLLVKFGTKRTDSAPAPGHLTANINLNAIGVAYSAVPFVMVSGFQTPMGAAPIGGGGHNIYAIVRYLTAAALNVDTRDSAGNDINGSFQWFTIGTY